MERSKDAFEAYLMGKVDEYVKQAARDTIVDNVSHDLARPRWARIPDGEACAFCRMLGSRGFVYHSELKAGGGGNRYHPYCNCQIAVSFDTVIEHYVKDGVRVSRGYSGSARPVKGTGGPLREADIDELFDEYVRSGRRFTPGTSKLFGRRRHVEPSKSPFPTIADMRGYLDGAVTMDDLRDRCEQVERWWDTDRFKDAEFRSLQHHVRVLKGELGG